MRLMLLRLPLRQRRLPPPPLRLLQRLPLPPRWLPGEVVKAPMPGVVLKVQVQQGQAVKAGQVLIILEAMKMENEIVAPKDGTVAQIVAAKGATVESGAPLVVLA